MAQVEKATVPTASENMMKKSQNSELPAPLRMKGGKSNRVRSKSESYHLRRPVENVTGPVVRAAAIKEKNERKPKNLKGNGGPKKGGAGGKGTWGKAGELYDTEESDDPEDPNYDAENDVVILHEVW